MIKKSFFQRMLAITLSAAIALSAPITTLAASFIGTTGEITAFEALPTQTANQEVVSGSSIQEINLPDTLAATVRMDISEEVIDSEVPVTEDIQSTVTIPITWESQPEFNGEIPGNYVFVSRLPEEYSLSEGVTAPVINVIVQASTEDDALIPEDGVITPEDGVITQEDELLMPTDDAAPMLQMTTSETGWTLDEEGRLTIISDAGMSAWSLIWSGDTRRGDVKTVIILDGVTCINAVAFYNCSALVDIVIPESVITIDYNAFYGCSALTMVEFPSGLTSIGQYLFAQCTALQTVAFRSINPPVIETGIFLGCNNLAKIYVPTSSVDAYKAASNLSSYANKIATKVISGNGWSLEEDGRLTITSNAGMSDWSTKRANNADKVRSIVIENGVTSILNGEFNSCIYLTDVTIPDSVTTIGQQAFRGCTSLESIILPNSLTVLDHQLFQECSSLRSITIPDTVTTINNYAFGGCIALEQVVIPDSVTSINYAAFGGCEALKNITIPSSVTQIGQAVFSDCTELTTVIFKNPTPPTIGNSLFYGSNKLERIYVSAGSVIIYKALPSLEIYKSKIYADTTDKSIVNNSGAQAEITYTGTEIDLNQVSGLFIIDENSGDRTYTVEEDIESVGEGMIAEDNKTLVITKVGTIKIGLITTETETHQAGTKVIAILTVSKGIQAAPTGIEKADVTTNGGSDGKIIGLTAGTRYEYKKGSDSYIEETANESGEITGLTAGSYVVRFAETSFYSASTDSTEIIIEQPNSLSNEKSVTGITHPEGAVINGTAITATVSGITVIQIINLTVSEGASWKLYADSACQNEIDNNTMTLIEGVNTAYIKVTAENGSNQIYTLTITRANQAPGVVLVQVISLTGGNTITTKNDSLQLTSQITPANASNKVVAWSIQSGSFYADISSAGILTARANGTVVVRATAQDGSHVYGEVTITITGQTTVDNNSGNNNSGNNTSNNEATTSGVEKITVDVKDGNTDSTVSKITIERTTGPDGTKRDTVTYQKEKASETVQKLQEEGRDTARIVIPDAKEEISELQVNIPAESLKSLSNSNINLQIDTAAAKIDIAEETLNSIGQNSDEDLYFRLIPVKDMKKQDAVASQALFVAGLINDDSNVKLEVIGMPVTIETNMPSTQADITLPLTGIKIPTNAAEREALLQRLAVYIEHSDGEKELVQGELVEYGEGSYGIRFHIKKFSIFTIVQTDAFVKSSECKIIDVIAPSNAVSNGLKISTTVANKTSNVELKIKVSKKATWKLYNDKACKKEISNTKLSIKEGVNTVYLKVTAENGETSKLYTLKITRKEAVVKHYSTQIKLGLIGSKEYALRVAGKFEKDYDTANVTIKKVRKYYRITMDFADEAAAKKACKDMVKRQYIVNYYFNK